MQENDIEAFDWPMFSRGAKSNIGFVYCLSNRAMPGLVKIGFTNRTTAIRADELSFGTKDSSATGVPLPFEIVKDWQVPGDRSEEIEQQIHHILHQHRVPAHGRWRAKEFFYLEPEQAILAIEQALQQLDWWAVSQAEKAKLEQEINAREERRMAENTRQKVLKEREQKIKQEITNKQDEWRKHAIQRKAGDGTTAGLKWGAIWFIGSLLIFEMMGANDSIGWLCFGLGVIAYCMTQDGPANAYLCSQEARNELDKIEGEVRHRLAPSSFVSVSRFDMVDSNAAPPDDNTTPIPATPKGVQDIAVVARLDAEQGDAAAQSWLGAMYYKGDGMAQDYVESLKFFRLAAAQGDAIAQGWLGSMYANGRGVSTDYVEAVKWYRMSAMQGNASAQYDLGWMYADGQGVTRDYVEALMFFRLAAAQGHAIAQSNLGSMYANGQGVSKDFVEAVRWFRLAAAQGDAIAQDWLGTMYYKGDGVAQDYVEALMFFRLAAAKGDATSQNNLGTMYAYGQGVTRDYVEAFKWYRLAAAQGDASAQFNLGWMYTNGQGVTRDDMRSFMWFNLSAASGFPDSISRRDEAAKTMTPQQIAEAQQMARDCQQRNFKGCD